MSVSDPFGGLTGSDRDAYVAITQMLKAYGIESLASAVLGFIQQGYSSDTITVLLQETDTYKQRFSANEVRRQKGLPVLSPAEYLATERAYRQVMSAAGLPVGFYDQPDDFTAWISNDTSPAEVQDRVQVATEMVNSLDPSIRQTWQQWYSTSDMVSYALDQERSTTVLDRQWKAAQAAGIAKDQGVRIGRDLAEQLGAAGVTQDQARQGFAAVNTVAANTNHLASVFGGTYTAEDATREVFLNDANAAEKRRTLSSQERAKFGGSSNIDGRALSRTRAGQV